MTGPVALGTRDIQVRRAHTKSSTRYACADDSLLRPEKQGWISREPSSISTLQPVPLAAGA